MWNIQYYESLILYSCGQNCGTKRNPNQGLVLLMNCTACSVENVTSLDYSFNWTLTSGSGNVVLHNASRVPVLAIGGLDTLDEEQAQIYVQGKNRFLMLSLLMVRGVISVLSGHWPEATKYCDWPASFRTFWPGWPVK